ncbi:MAG: arsenate reductase (azurin) small subunit [Rhodocyclaceae bacterium]|nr:arsenate reductase (azurin) small subunit [Rhodocyclaceae bacterium]
MTNTLIPLRNGHREEQPGHLCMSRRQFLLAGGALVTLSALGVSSQAEAAPLHALLAKYPKLKIGRLSALKTGEPLTFAYPYPDVRNILVRLGTRAGGGIGPDQDVVAFNQQCTHMGGPLEGTFKNKYQALGPCPLHLTTFDLTRYGMVISGHGTESLPQILLALEGDDIHAVGVQGLVYGYGAMTAQRA